jgi:hypothetical protein
VPRSRRSTGRAPRRRGFPDRQHQEGQWNRGQSDQEEDQLPGPHLSDDRQRDVRRATGQLQRQPPEQRGETAADDNADRVDADGGRQPSPGEEVGDHRVGRGRQRGLAHTDRGAAGHQLAERARQPTADRGEGPEDLADDDDDPPAVAVHGPADREPRSDVEEREGGTHQDADLSVAQIEIGLDQVDEQREDVAVEVRVDVDRHHDQQAVPGVESCPAGLVALLRRARLGTVNRGPVRRRCGFLHGCSAHPPGTYQIGDDQARSWMVVGRFGAGATPARTASQVDHRQVGFWSTRT